MKKGIWDGPKHTHGERASGDPLSDARMGALLCCVGRDTEAEGSHLLLVRYSAFPSANKPQAER